MPSFTVPVVLLSLLQGCAYPQPFIAMSDSPNPPHSQPPEVASVAASPNRSQEIKLKLSDYQWQYRILLLFAPSTGSADYRQQLQAWQADVAGTDDRDLKLVANFRHWREPGG
jgi:hypothetical protein